MSTRHLVALVAAAGLLLAGCSDDLVAVPPAATAVPAPTPTAEPTVQAYGKSYSLAYSECAQKIWDGRVAVWNKLVQARDAKGALDVVEKGVTYPDQAAYFEAKKWPATHEATLLAPATQKACG